jgi:hypothetical protein
MQASFSSPYRPQLPTDLGAIIGAWTTDVLSAQKALIGLPEEARLVIRYEDLVLEPELTLKKVCAWVGVAYSKEMLQFHERNRRGALEPSGTIQWKMKTLSRIDATSIGTYKKELSTEEREVVARLAGGLLEQFDYALDP